MSKDELYAEAKRLNIAGRSKMTKTELEAAIKEVKSIDAQVTEVYNTFQPETMAPYIDSDIEFSYTALKSAPKPQPVHMPNSERVQKYARQRDGLMFKSSVDIRTKLTPRQMRRVRKNANKHGEDFTCMYGPAWEGYSLLARTPEGMGIFYQFSK